MDNQAQEQSPVIHVHVPPIRLDHLVNTALKQMDEQDAAATLEALTDPMIQNLLHKVAVEAQNYLSAMAASDTIEDGPFQRVRIQAVAATTVCMAMRHHGELFAAGTHPAFSLVPDEDGGADSEDQL